MAKESLTEYSAKRTFAATPEPPPALPAAAGGPLLFVVQQHSATRLHYDFRLECDGVLQVLGGAQGPVARSVTKSASPCRPRIIRTTMPRSKA